MRLRTVLLALSCLLSEGAAGADALNFPCHTPDFSGGVFGGPLLLSNGSATNPSWCFAGDDDGTCTGMFRSATNQPSISINGVESYRITATTWSMLNNGAIFRMGAGADVRFRRLSPGVFTTYGSTDTSIGTLLGGGAPVASATSLPAPTGNVFHVTGTTNITSLTATNLVSGACFTMIFDSAVLVSDGNNLKLEGDFQATTDDTLSGCFDGTAFFETSRKVN